MRTLSHVFVGVGVTCACFSLLTNVALGAPKHKVSLCHVPPGHPADAHTIVVAERTAARHLANHPGDYPGACASGCQITDCPFAESTKMETAVDVTDAFFGMNVSLNGDLMGVASLGDNHAGLWSGAAYIFRREGSQWVVEAKLTSSDAMPQDWFGDIAVDGDRAVVSAPTCFCAEARPAGAVFVFRREGTTWTEEAKLTVTDVEQPYDAFANAVSISGDRVVVGARWDYHDDAASGAAYVFRREGSDWVRETKLTSEGSENDEFGFSVSMDGDYLAVSAVCEEVAGVSGFCVGSVYVFKRKGKTWTLRAKLSGSDASDRDYFGYSVCLDGDLLIVGANRASGIGAGSAYVFRRRGNSWTEEAKLVPDDARSGGSFGDSVAISGNTALVGGVFAGGGPSGENNGAVYVFRRVGDEWLESNRLFAADEADGDLFGISVAVNGNTAAAGAVVADGVSGAGGVHVFDLCHLDCTP